MLKCLGQTNMSYITTFVKINFIQKLMWLNVIIHSI